MYITFDEYTNFYDTIDEKTYNRLAIDACRMLDNHTSGVDGVNKLKLAYPTDENDVQAVKLCAAKIINLLFRIEETEKMSGYESTYQGMRGKLVSSVSAGNESISFAAGPASAIEKASADPNFKNALIADTIRQSLSGVRDAYGVNLLYMGPYPRRCMK